MNVELVSVGVLPTDCYIVSDGSACVVIDPGDEPSKIFPALAGRTPSHILITHCHPDHVGAVGFVEERFPEAKVVIGKVDAPAVNEIEGFLKVKEGFSAPYRFDILVSDGDVVDCGGSLAFKVISTPGHTAGGVCYLLEEEGILFSGDTLFANGVGRTDFATGSAEDMRASLRKLAALPDATRVYPGHGPATTIGDEAAENLLVQRARMEIGMEPGK